MSGLVGDTFSHGVVHIYGDYKVLCLKAADRMANSVVPDQGLYCLTRPVCLKT